MLDIHAHILPGLDDGPRDWDEAVEMCTFARKDGIETIVASPHTLNGVYDNPPKKVLEQVERLKHLLRQNCINLEVLPGSEVHVCPDCVDRILNKEVLTINNSGEYVLLELPFEVISPGIENLIFDLLVKGIKPVLAHPERNREVSRKPGSLLSLVEKGALVQITGSSLVGGFGRTVRDCARILLESNMVHVIASDAHSANGRPPVLSEAREQCAELIGEERASQLTVEFPRNIIQGREFTVPEPEYKARKEGFFSMFFDRKGRFCI